MTQQIPMAFDAPPSYGCEDFVVSSSNHAAYDQVMAWPQWSAPAMWLCGEAGSGKTHLARIWAAKAQARMGEGALPAHSAEAFGQARALLLDNLPIEEHEETLFHLLNFVKETRFSLLLVQEKTPAQMEISLPDLASRLRALPVSLIAPPDDLLLQAVMVKQLTDKQLRVAPEVIHYLLRRIDRSCLAVRLAVEHMDRQALEQGRSITLPFVKKIFTHY